MKKWVLVLSFGAPVMLLAADRTPEPFPADRAAKVMQLPDGFHATVFAAEPDIVQPISFCIDARGRLFVAEGSGSCGTSDVFFADSERPNQAQ